MILASHNSWSFHPPKNWWMRPFSFVAKCQSKNIKEQYETGVRLFDLRVRFDKKGEPILAHGLMEYKSMWLMGDLGFLNGQKYSIVRVILETSKEDERQEKLFKDWCLNIRREFKNVRFIGGNRKFDWTNIYKFGTFEPAIVGEFSSVPNNKWYSKINDLWPWLWAKLHNDEVVERHITYDGYVMIDFV